MHSQKRFLGLLRWKPPMLIRATSTGLAPSIANPEKIPSKNKQKHLRRLTTFHLLRSYTLGQVFRSATLSSLSIHILRGLAHPKYALLDVSKNPLLARIVRRAFYDHFCAGENATEVREKVRSLKVAGHTGVILCPGRETFVEDEADLSYNEERMQKEVVAWRDLACETLGMAEEGDFAGVKLSAAGPSISRILAERGPLPVEFFNALTTICTQAHLQRSQVWIDAEQAVLQPAIDEVAIQCMRRFNRNGQIVVLNTYQAYLKAIRLKLGYHLRLAHEEGWAMGIKLVRGAYIATDPRETIHDTKAETDASYNGIVRDLLHRNFDGLLQSEFPSCKVFLAGHNIQTIQTAVALSRNLARQHRLSSPTQFGQLSGMADEVSSRLLDYMEEDMQREKPGAKGRLPIESFKCLTWGSMKDCMHFLSRRAIENQGAAARLAESTRDVRRELVRRLLFRG